MEVVGHLVGLDADQRRTNGEQRSLDRFGGGLRQRGREHRPRQGQAPFPERKRATDEILPKTRLRFMDAEGGRFAPRQAERLLPQPLLVEAMAGLVEHSEQRGRQVRLVPAGGDPAVMRPGRAAKRVLRRVEASTVEVEPDPFGHSPDKHLLCPARKMPPQDVVEWRVGRPRAGPDEGHEARSEAVEEGRNVTCPGTGLVVVEEGIVGIEIGGLAARLFAFQRDDVGELRSEALPIGASPRVDPGLLAFDAGPGGLLDQPGREADVLAIIPKETEDRRPLVRTPVAPLHRHRQPLQPISLGRIGAQAVGQGGDGGHLVGPVSAAGGGQHRLFVPPEDRFDRREHRGPTGVGSGFVEITTGGWGLSGRWMGDAHGGESMLRWNCLATARPAPSPRPPPRIPCSMPSSSLPIQTTPSSAWGVPSR